MRRSLGLDFGTTNSAVAIAEGGATRLARFGDLEVCRSILFFDPPARAADGVPKRPRLHAGPVAIERYLEAGGQGRLMQSLKSFLSSAHLKATAVFGHTYTLEQLIAAILRELYVVAREQLGDWEGPVVAGRPVRFAWSESPADDARAESRLREALALAGFEDVTFEHEPVGAAHQYEATLDHDELAMVADLGGGTSDFCLLEVGPLARARRHRILGTSGVSVGGDTFDAALVHELVTPALGRGSEHRSDLGKILPNPAWIYALLSRWHQLSLLKTPENRELLQSLKRQALDPGKIDRLIELVENDRGYALYRAVEDSKIDLSSREATTFSFDTSTLPIEAPLARATLEGHIAPDLARIDSCISELLQRTGAAASDVDRIFLTGGSGQVPAVRALLASRFGEHKLATGDFLLSVARGLALRAASDGLEAS